MAHLALLQATSIERQDVIDPKSILHSMVLTGDAPRLPPARALFLKA
jgi:hypothetical protein